MVAQKEIKLAEISLIIPITPSIHGTEAEGWQIRGQPEELSKTLS